ncbi:Uncharacterised protein [Budvicia aquatica]|uniref:Uncharacterized protein n=1 Tax=Budvicia aquatica TaxID=82979 RepID=A0A484ZKE5_9GAMM|nr:Uncharacterised protein [Budvicia aquatica]
MSPILHKQKIIGIVSLPYAYSIGRGIQLEIKNRHPFLDARFSLLMLEYYQW